MFVEIKPLCKISLSSARADAHDQMCDRFRAYLQAATPPTLIGLSAFGHMVCPYELTTATGDVTPKELPLFLNYVTDIAPQERWDLDLMTDEGRNQLVAIIEQVKNVVLAEGMCKCHFAALH